MTTSNMGLTQPTPSIATGPGWATSLNTNSDIIDVHDHSSGKGIKIGTSGLDIQADFNVNANRVSSAKSVLFSSQTSSLASTDANGIYCYNGNLFYVNGTTDVQITNGTSLAGTPGSVTGLVSPASILFSAQNFSFFYASSTFADLSCRNVNLYQGANALQLTYGGSSSYTCTLPGAVPSQSALVVMNASGVLSNGLSPSIGSDATGIVTFNSRIGIGSTGGIEPTVADSGYLGTVSKPLGGAYLGSFDSIPKTVSGAPYALTDIPTFKAYQAPSGYMGTSTHTPGSNPNQINFTSTNDATSDPICAFTSSIRTSSSASSASTNRKTFSWYNKTTEQMYLTASNVLTTGNISSGSISSSGAISGVSLSCTNVFAAGAISGVSLGLSGGMSCTTVTASGGLSCTTLTASSGVSCTTVTASGAISSGALSSGAISATGTITSSAQVSGTNANFLSGVRTTAGGPFVRQISYTTTTTTGAGEFATLHLLDWTKILSINAYCYYAAGTSYVNCTYIQFNSTSVFGSAASPFGASGVDVRILITYSA